MDKMKSAELEELDFELELSFEEFRDSFSIDEPMKTLNFDDTDELLLQHLLKMEVANPCLTPTLPECDDPQCCNSVSCAKVSLRDAFQRRTSSPVPLLTNCNACTFNMSMSMSNVEAEDAEDTEDDVMNSTSEEMKVINAKVEIQQSISYLLEHFHDDMSDERRKSIDHELQEFANIGAIVPLDSLDEALEKQLQIC